MLKLVRRPKSPYWYVRGTLRRVRVEESTGIDDKKAAEEIRAKREAEILAESVYGRRATVTFAEAALSYIECGGSRRFANPVIEHFGTTPLVRVDQDAIERGARKAFPHASDATRDRQFFTPSSAIMRHAAKRGWCAPLLLQRPSPSAERVRYLTPDEADRLIAASSARLGPLIVFLLYTGARVGEALWLDWRDVDLAPAHVTFARTKNGEARGVPLHQRLVAVLANLGHREGEVFRRPDGHPYERPSGFEDHSAGTRIKTAFRGAAPVGARASCGREHEIASRRQRHTRGRWCRRRALSPFHGVIQGVSVGNVDKGAAAAKCRQSGDCPPLSLRAKQQAQCGFDHFGHRAALTRGLALEFGHHAIVDVESRLHMGSHIIQMVIWQEDRADPVFTVGIYQQA
jgi:integrase